MQLFLDSGNQSATGNAVAAGIKARTSQHQIRLDFLNNGKDLRDHRLLVLCEVVVTTDDGLDHLTFAPQYSVEQKAGAYRLILDTDAHASLILSADTAVKLVDIM